MNHLRPHMNHARAFSLVEVTLALAVIALTIVPLLALLPVGLNSHCDAMDSMVGAQILQRVSADIQETDFDTLIPSNQTSPYILPMRYFDDQANELEAAAGVRLYDVRTTVAKPSPVPLGQHLSDNLATIKIEIASNPAKGTDPFGSGRSHTFYVTVARNK